MPGVQCCGRPHGNMALFAPTLSVIAFILASSGTNWCDFVLRTVAPIDGSYNYNNPEVTTGIGLYSFQGWGQYEGSCVWYQTLSYTADVPFQLSRIFAGLAQGFGGIAMIILLFSSCVALSRNVWRACGAAFLLSSLFQGLTLLIFRSVICHHTIYDNTNRTASCSLMRGSRCCIAAVVFWFLASLSVLKYDPPRDSTQDGSPRVIQEMVTRTEEVKPDGTKVITTRTEYTNV